MRLVRGSNFWRDSGRRQAGSLVYDATVHRFNLLPVLKKIYYLSDIPIPVISC